jgi:hypothetical protein
MVPAGEGGLKLNEEYPQRYAKARSLPGRPEAQASSMTAKAAGQ